MVAQKVDAKIEQVQNVRDNTVEKVRDYQRWGSQTINDVKQIGVDKVQAALETPYGQKVNRAIEIGLDSVDSALEKYLPEGKMQNFGFLILFCSLEDVNLLIWNRLHKHGKVNFFGKINGKHSIYEKQKIRLGVLGFPEKHIFWVLRFVAFNTWN